MVPLALPLMAGPGAISSCVVWVPAGRAGRTFRTGADQHRIRVLLLAVVPLRGLWVKYLGQTGINVVTRIMGLMLMSLGIELIITGMKMSFRLLS